MSKTCPNCGVNSPDNAKFCIECAESLEGVPINKEEKVKKTPSSSSDDGGSVIPCIIGIIIVVVIVVAAASFIFNSGGEDAQKNITVTFSDVYVFSGTSSGVQYYYYYVNGFINNFPNDLDGYAVKTLYSDKNDNELVSTTEKLSYFERSKDSKYDTLISSYATPNYLDVDHVTVQIIKDGVVLNEYKSNMNTNKLTQSPTTPTNNSSK